jgi:hypothetical protein
MNWYKRAAKIPWKMVSEKKFSTEEGDFEVYSIIAETKKPIHPGEKILYRAGVVSVHKGKEGFTIRNILFSDDVQRLGIGTEIYEIINKKSIKETGRPLMSTKPRKTMSGDILHELNDASRGLWEKLVKDEKAKAIENNSYRFKEKNELV